LYSSRNIIIIIIIVILADNCLNIYIHIIIITMAQQPYMGSGLLLPPLSEVTKSCAFVAVGDCPPEPSGRQSGDLGEKWRL
jgi:hypothetical protein